MNFSSVMIFLFMTIMIAVMIFQEKSHDSVMKNSETLTRSENGPHL